MLSARLCRSGLRASTKEVALQFDIAAKDNGCNRADAGQAMRQDAATLARLVGRAKGWLGGGGVVVCQSLWPRVGSGLANFTPAVSRQVAQSGEWTRRSPSQVQHFYATEPGERHVHQSVQH